MASPTLVNSATTANNTSATSQPLTMPASIVAGRLLVAYVFNGAAPSLSGWTQIFTVHPTLFLTGFAKIAAGSDTGTVTTVSSNSIAAVVEQYDSWSGSISDIVTATSSTATPPLDNPGVSQDWLWVAVLGVLMSGGGAVTAAPTSYGDFVTAQTSGGVAAATADRALTASSETPGVFTTTGTPNFPCSATIAIAPAAVAALPASQRHNRAALVRSYHY